MRFGLLAFLLLYAPLAYPIEDFSRDVKTIISARSCANCHTPGLPDAKLKALQVFDLSRDDWFSKMTKKQLQSFQSRLFTQLSPDEAKELGGGTPDRPLQDREKSTVIQFVLERSLAPR